MKITYEILDTCTDENRTILEDYWLLEKNKPVFKVAELLEKYQLSSTELTKIVHENSFGLRDDYKCSNCEYEVKFSSRTHAIAPYWKHRSKISPRKGNGICDDCIDEIDRQNELLREQQRQELIAERIERDKTVPHAMYDEWQPELTDEDILDIFDVELQISTLTYYFIDFYRPKKHIKHVTSLWNKKFFKHCERHANWKKEKLASKESKKEENSTISLNVTEASNKWRWDSEPTYTINSIVTNKKQ